MIKWQKDLDDWAHFFYTLKGGYLSNMLNGVSSKGILLDEKLFARTVIQLKSQMTKDASATTPKRIYV